MNKSKHDRPGGGLARRDCVRFAVIFLSVIGIFYTLSLVPWIERNLLLPTLELSASLCSSLINVLGGNTESKGVLIRGANYSIAVRRGCDPAEPIVMFAAAVAAFPAPSRQKFIGIILGAVAIFGINLVRIASLFWVGKSYPSLFMSVHQEIWPAFFIVGAILMWLTWLRWVRKAPTSSYA